MENVKQLYTPCNVFGILNRRNISLQPLSVLRPVLGKQSMNTGQVNDKEWDQPILFVSSLIAEGVSGLFSIFVDTRHPGFTTEVTCVF